MVPPSSAVQVQQIEVELFRGECNRAESSGPQLEGNGALEAFPPSPTSTIVFGVWNWMKNGLTALHGKGNIDRGANCEFCAFPQTFKHVVLAPQELFALHQPWMGWSPWNKSYRLFQAALDPMDDPGWIPICPPWPESELKRRSSATHSNPFSSPAPRVFHLQPQGLCIQRGKYIFQPDGGADQTR